MEWTLTLSLCSPVVQSGGLVAGHLHWTVPDACSIRRATLCLFSARAPRGADPPPEGRCAVASLDLSQATLYDPGTHLFLFLLHVPVGTLPTVTAPSAPLRYWLEATLERSHYEDAVVARPVEITGPASVPYGGSAVWTVSFLTDAQSLAIEAARFQESELLRRGVREALQAERHARLEALVPETTVAVHENERRIYFLGWFKWTLLPTDPASFTDERGRPTSMDDAPPGDGWQWAGDWRLDPSSPGDPEGWRYGNGWAMAEALGIQDWRPAPDSLSIVRRRRWVRTCRNADLAQERERVRAECDSELAAFCDHMREAAALDRAHTLDRRAEHRRRAEEADRRLTDFLIRITPVVQGRVPPLVFFDTTAFAPPPTAPLSFT